jgi:hypothetical protein
LVPAPAVSVHDLLVE